ncbi:MAG: formylmethanofuran dehydrogenase subunit [Thermodesulfobacteriota bacterium]|nr:formylmethanofuran dehydrogenase subunit [Thermodesulfobacteriota bacterium]
MNADEIMEQEDFKRCAEFHGHICPGLAIGYRAGKAALAWLEERRSPDEEMVATVETNACGTDAIQVLTGCTLGKGNLLFKDQGKHVYTIVSRKTGEGVRIALLNGVMNLSDRHLNLIQKIREDQASPEERREFQTLHLNKGRQLLETPLEELFSIRNASAPVPEKAMIEPSMPCDRCQEPTMLSRLEKINGQSLCRGCAG